MVTDTFDPTKQGMKSTATHSDRFCFWVSGVDPLAMGAHPDISWEERSVAQGYTALLLVVMVVNFVCTALSVHDVFIDMQLWLTRPGYWVVVVVPFAAVWTLVVFSLFRFLIQIGHHGEGELWTRVRRLLAMAPVWCLIPLLGMLAAAPLQVRALADDIRVASVLARWNSLSEQLLELQLAQARDVAPTHHPCVNPLMRADVVLSYAKATVDIANCSLQIEAEVIDAREKSHSVQLLNTIKREVRDDGLIARVGTAFEAAPGTAWIIAILMMCLYAAPVLTRAVAHKRAYEYLEYDRGRRDLMLMAGIELHAHEAFDAVGRSVPLHRYRHVEALQRRKLAAYDAAVAYAVESFDARRRAVGKHLEISPSVDAASPTDVVSTP